MNTTQTHPSRMLHLLIALTMVIAGCLFTSPVANAQLPGKDESSLQNTNTASDLKISKQSRFTARLVEGTVYLNWYMLGETENSVFIVERSVNGGAFTSIGFKDGFAAPDASLELLYSFKDTQPLSGTCAYRVRQFKNAGFYSGQQVSIEILLPLDLVIKEN